MSRPSERSDNLQSPMTVHEQIAVLAAAFPQRQIEQATLDVYAGALQDLDPGKLERATRHIIATSRYFPTIAELRTAYFEAELALPSGIEAWAEVERSARMGEGPNGIRPPLAAAVARQIGWVQIRMSENPDIIRSQFVKAYESARENTVKMTNIESMSKAQIEGPGHVQGPSRGAIAATAARTIPDRAGTVDGE
jgi:hypothetical protein